MQTLPQALAPLGNFRQWVLWIAVPDPKRPGKTNKFPINPQTGAVVTAHDPNLWLTFEEAAQWLPNSSANGVGFVFTENDPFFFLDVDNALVGGQWSPHSLDLCQKFAGAAVEISNSGTGFHIIGTCAPVPHGCTNKALGLELYTEKRFVALTGREAVGNAFHNCQPAFNNLVAEFFPPREHELSQDWTDLPCPEWNGTADDDELLRKAMASTSAGSTFGHKASFLELWIADVERLSIAFPTKNDHDAWGLSEAEAALCSHLAFWTGRNCERIDRLFRLSGLMRDKWEREDYARNTVLLSCSGAGDVYGATRGDSNQRDFSRADVLPGVAPAALDRRLDQRPVDGTVAPKQMDPPMREVISAPVSTQAQFSDREAFINSTEMPDYFKGCVYVLKNHAILTPGGHLLDQGRFKAKYGGAIFSLDALGNKTTRNAWEALTENISLRFPKVDKTAFAPEMEPGSISDHQGESVVNTYWPITVERQAGDPSIFINHINKLLPSGDDARILLNYMAALIQNPGHKFQWCPVVQGPKGNGKTLLIECLTNAVGEKYTHLPSASDLGGNGGKFNEWMVRKLFIGVDEIYCAERREVLEMLKDKITNRRIEMQGKGTNQDMGDNRTNWLMLTNHKDAIPLDVDERRYCVMYCAQQSYKELLDAGMDVHYFNKLFRWLRKENGFAIITNFLLDFPVEEQFNPSESGLAQRAPASTSTQEAVKMSAGVIEQEVLEAVGQGRAGFADPWISSMALDRLLKEIKRTLPNAKRPEMLHSLGYVPHPGLSNGRVNNATLTDQGKTRLYYKQGHLVGQLTQPAEISKRYDSDQNVNPSAAERAFG